MTYKCSLFRTYMFPTRSVQEFFWWLYP